MIFKIWFVFSWIDLFFQNCKAVAALMPHMNCFQKEICHPYFLIFSLLVAFKIQSFITSFIASCCDYDVCWGSFTSVSYAWGLLSFLDLWGINFHQKWKFFSHCFFKYIFLSPLLPAALHCRDSNYICVRPFEVNL